MILYYNMNFPVRLAKHELQRTTLIYTILLGKAIASS